MQFTKRIVAADGKTSLVNRRGRKYLTALGRQRFVEVAQTDPNSEIQTFTQALTYTSFRVSEALVALLRH